MLDQYPNFKFAIPAFHSYGHKPECQVNPLSVFYDTYL